MSTEGIRNVQKKSCEGNQEVKGLCTKLFPFTQIMNGVLHTQANVLTQSTDFYVEYNVAGFSFSWLIYHLCLPLKEVSYARSTLILPNPVLNSQPLVIMTVFWCHRD